MGVELLRRLLMYQWAKLNLHEQQIYIVYLPTGSHSTCTWYILQFPCCLLT